MQIEVFVFWCKGKKKRKERKKSVPPAGTGNTTRNPEYTSSLYKILAI